MKSEYKLQFLSDGEFEALSLVNPRYRNTKDDLGFADKATNRIFVRKTGVKPLDMFVTNHEIEEILAKNSSHEDEFGIRHKKVFKDIIAPYILPAITALAGGAFLGPLIGGTSGSLLGAGATTMGPALGGAVGGAVGSAASQAGTTGKVDPLKTILAGAGGSLMGVGGIPGVAASKAVGGGPLGQMLSGAQSALGFQSGAQKILSSAQPVTNAAGQAMNWGETAGAAPYLNNVPITTSGALNNALGSQAFNASQALGFAANGLPANLASAQRMGGTALPTSGSQAGAPVGTSQTGMGTTTAPVTPAIGSAGQIGTQAGTQAATKTPLLQKLFGGDWRQALIGGGISMLGNMGSPQETFTPDQSALFQDLTQRIQSGAQVQLTPAQQQAITSNYDSQLQTAKQNVMDRYKYLRPGSDISNDSQLKEALLELEGDFAEQKANALAAAQLGLSQQQTQMMSELAAMDVYSIAMKAGISTQEAAQFKNMMSQLGFMIASGGGQSIYSQ